MAEVDSARLASCKAYLRLDYDTDDGLIVSLLHAVDDYLAGAGITRDQSPPAYDLIAHDMVLRIYDGRDVDAVHAATAPLVRSMLTQLKLRAAYGGDAE